MLDTQRARRYERSGLLYPLRVLTPVQAGEALADFGRIEKATGGPLTRFDAAHLFFPWAYDLATHPKLLDAMEALLGPDLLIWGSLIANKPARSGFNFAWHQDSAFCKFLRPAPAATAWIALTDSNAGNGCLKVLPGSHRDELDHAEIDSDDNILLQKQQVAVPVQESDAEDVVLKAGEMSIQHMSVLHRSSANRSAAPRTGFIVRFSTPAMPSCPYPVVHARGSADCSHLDLWSRPADKPVAEALADRDAWKQRQS